MLGQRRKTLVTLYKQQLLKTITPGPLYNTEDRIHTVFRVS